MIRVISSKFLLKIKKGPIKENWGFPFLFVFVVLLAGVAVFLSAGLSYLSDTLVIYAFYALFVGVVLQLFSFLKPVKPCKTGVN
ncbi:MAG: hypothetical protein LBC03_01750 [Nitrososphaerota archaeon]|jgi:hypothetical protein|nr:hypothetical protein [Nitrososphaerota archaeon]